MAKISINNDQKACFWKKLWPKIPNALTMVIYTITGDPKYSEGSIFFAEKIWSYQIILTLKYQFLP